MLIFNPLASFTRPADTTAYASGDLVANSTTNTSVTPLSFVLGGQNVLGHLRVVRVRLYKSTATTTNASFRIHLYQASPTVTNGDNGAWLSTGSADWLGNIDVTAMFAFSDGAAGNGSLPAGSEAFLRLKAGATIYGLIEARAAYAPGNAEVFTAVLEEVDSF